MGGSMFRINLLLLLLTSFHLCWTDQTNEVASGGTVTVGEGGVRIASLYTKLFDCIRQEVTTVYYDNKPSRRGNNGERDCLKTGFLQDLQELVIQFVEIEKENERLRNETKIYRVGFKKEREVRESEIARLNQTLIQKQEEHEICLQEKNALRNNVKKLGKCNEKFLYFKGLKDGKGNSALHLAAVSKDKQAVKDILELGEDFDAVNDNLETPIMAAATAINSDSAMDASLNLIKYFIESGANVRATDGSGQTFLHKLFFQDGVNVTSAQFKDLAEYLIAKNVSELFNVKDNVFGRPSIRLAMKTTEIDNATMTLLQSRGVDFCALGKQGRPRNCEEIQGAGHNQSGVYTIYLSVKNKAEENGINVYCDLVTDGGGWTVFQRRQPSTTKVDFERTWREYADGFGILTESHWLGLDIVSELTKGGDAAELRIDLMDWGDEKGFAKYDHFQVDNETEKYKMHVSGHSGDVGNPLTGSKEFTVNGIHFSTQDRDNDKNIGGNCAKHHHGAWWHNSFCSLANLNGLYYENGRNVPLYTGVFWNNWHGVGYSMKRTEMKLRSKHFCKPTKG